LYADSLEVQKVQPPPTKPRIAAWTRKMLDTVIKEDTNRDGSFGKLKVFFDTATVFFFFLSTAGHTYIFFGVCTYFYVYSSRI